MELTPRKEQILSSIVRTYTASGEPVGSKRIAEEIGFSSATVRNEMADMYEMGLLEQPHTSAGRVPSQAGYREYVNRYKGQAEIPKIMKEHIDAALLEAQFDREKLLDRASDALAAATGFTTAATSPGGSTARIRAVQFVQISRRAAMLILMSSAGTMKTRVFHCDFDLTNEIMRIFFRLFNEKLSGKTVAEITPAFIQKLGISFGDMAMLMSSPLMALLEAAKETDKPGTITHGRMNLLLYSEYTPGWASRIVHTLDDSNELNLLLTCKVGKVSVLIGTETGRSEFRNSSIVMSRYLINDTDAGGIAVVGPMRMDYPVVSECVSYVASRVGEIFTALMNED